MEHPILCTNGKIKVEFGLQAHRYKASDGRSEAFADGFNEAVEVLKPLVCGDDTKLEEVQHVFLPHALESEGEADDLVNKLNTTEEASNRMKDLMGMNDANPKTSCVMSSIGSSSTQTFMVKYDEHDEEAKQGTGWSCDDLTGKLSAEFANSVDLPGGKSRNRDLYKYGFMETGKEADGMKKDRQMAADYWRVFKKDVKTKKLIIRNAGAYAWFHNNYSMTVAALVNMAEKLDYRHGDASQTFKEEEVRERVVEALKSRDANVTSLSHDWFSSTSS